MLRLIRMLSKRLRISSYEYVMFAVVAGAVLLRFILIRFNWPVTDGDESVMDLMATHIAYHHEHPTFFYGQNYMGPIEAYIGALLFRLFGVSIFALRLGLLPFFALFLVCMYYLTRRLYTEKFALFTVTLLSLGSSEVIRHQLLAIGGYPEIMLFGSLIFFLAIWLAFTYTPDQQALERRRRILVYGLWGIVVGVALWVDQLILPCILTASCLLWFFCRRELLSWSGGALLVGMLVGALPLIIYNLTAPLSENFLGTLLYLHRVGAADVLAKHITFSQQLTGIFLVSLPVATGAHQFCNLLDTSYSTAFFSMSQCALSNGLWATGAIILWTIAVLMAMLSLWRLLRQTPARNWSFEQRQDAVRRSARLMLLVSAFLSFVLFATSSAAALYPLTASRYLICLLFAMPAVLWPLWRGVAVVNVPSARHIRAGNIVRLGLLLLIATTFFIGTISTFADIPVAQAAYNKEEQLVHYLESIGATRIYSDYWTCNPTLFQSHEHIICAVLNANLGRGDNRYKLYYDMLRATKHPAYVFPLDTSQAAAFARVHHGDIHYRQRLFQGYIIYV